MKKELASFDWEADIVDNGTGAVFATTGLSAVVCTSYAEEVRRLLGADRVKIWGFFADDNPSAKIGEIAEGHDFAIVDGRFIVDPWVAHVESISEEFVFEIGEDSEVIEALYGSCWKLVE